MSTEWALRMFSLSVFFLGLMVVIDSAPVKLDKDTSKFAKSYMRRLGVRSGAQHRFTSRFKREEKGSQKHILPRRFHSSNAKGDIDEIPMTWDADSNVFPAPFPISVSKQMKIKNSADGSFPFGFESEDGTNVFESDSQKRDVGPKPEDIGIVSRGSYSFTTPDGVVLTVNWVADENGFQTTGDHLPTPPPQPEHRLKYEVNSMAIVRSSRENQADDSYSFSFESADGTNVFESDNQKLVGPKPGDIDTVSKGSYTYLSPEGNTLTVNWVAEENGFQATDDHHLPTPPPMPEPVVKVLAKLKNAGVL